MKNRKLIRDTFKKNNIINDFYKPNFKIINIDIININEIKINYKYNSNNFFIHSTPIFNIPNNIDPNKFFILDVSKFS